MRDRLLLFILLFCVSFSLKAELSPIRLLFPTFEPFTYIKDGEPSGIGVDAVRSVIQSLNQPLELISVPNYGRAVQEVTAGNADGFFLASQNEERDAIAVFSHPVTNNNWMWFLKKESEWEVNSNTFRQHAQVGTFLHANTHKWLIKQQFQNIHPIPKTSYLPALVDRGMIDAVLLAEMVYIEQAAAVRIPMENFQKHLVIVKPFGIYIAKSYLTRHPDYMIRLNEGIKQYQSNVK